MIIAGLTFAYRTGTSEGAVAVARHRGDAFAGRMTFAWSCEPNCFVVEEQHRHLAPRRG